MHTLAAPAHAGISDWASSPPPVVEIAPAINDAQKVLQAGVSAFVIHVGYGGP